MNQLLSEQEVQVSDSSVVNYVIFKLQTKTLFPQPYSAGATVINVKWQWEVKREREYTTHCATCILVFGSHGLSYQYLHRST